MHLLKTTLLLAGLAACAELDPPTLIARDRVLGAKVTVDGAPDRAWPARGEHATVTWVTASPGPTPTFAWVLAACPAATSTGLPACAGPLLASATSSGSVPALALAIPADLATPAVVVTGTICASGAPVIDPAGGLAECDDGSRAELVSQHVFIAADGATNHNPQLAAAPIALGGAPWPAAGAGCDGLPIVAAGGPRQVLGVTFTAADRETYVAGDAPAREELQLAAFATAGELLQQHNYVDADDERPTSTVAIEWDPPGRGDVPAGGRVAFHFVVRDLRGGVDATTRALCIQ